MYFETVSGICLCFLLWHWVWHISLWCFLSSNRLALLIWQVMMLWLTISINPSILKLTPRYFKVYVFVYRLFMINWSIFHINKIVNLIIRDMPTSMWPHSCFYLYNKPLPVPYYFFLLKNYNQAWLIHNQDPAGWQGRFIYHKTK